MRSWPFAFGLLVAFALAAAADDAPRIYARGVKDRAAVVRELAARSAGYASVLVVLDLATFAPPPGECEFAADHRYREDLPDWFTSIATLAAAAGKPTSVAATSSRKPVPVAGGWREAIERDLGVAWWKAEGFAFEPAAKWIARLLDERTARGGTAPSCMLVLITGDILPEQAVRGVFDVRALLHDVEGAPEWLRKGTPADESWRSRLLPVGAYWDEEEVATVLRKRSSALSVVAPESRFGDFLPVVEMPDVPWASRPVAPPDVGGASRRLDEQLKPTLPDDAERARAVERVQEALGAFTLRFESSTPTFCRHYGQGVFFNTDCPSGFGYWPFARAVAATGGKYLFYPYPPGKWLDPSPHDESLLSRLAPELTSKEDYLRAKRNDVALDAICEACLEVVDQTPWSDSADDPRERASGWMFFRSTKPFAIHERTPQRDRPIGDIPELADKSPAKLRKEGEELARVARRYDRAIGILESAETSILKGARATAHPRSIANLALARFWFEMSAFHLEALSIFLKESSRLRERGVVTYVPTIRMSDCLDGYEDLTISPEDELRFRSDFQPPEYQGNLLSVPLSDPKYRAKRDVERVLERLDPRLRGRALRMIAAAESVMQRYARSPWGAVVYYSEAMTFVSEPVPEGVAEFDREGEDPGLLRPTTPRPGSSPGGPTSGG